MKSDDIFFITKFVLCDVQKCSSNSIQRTLTENVSVNKSTNHDHAICYYLCVFVSVQQQTIYLDQ